ncbi:TIGR00730 family Rossman fold protein [Nostoc ellipsosporum NOK]|uniref:LOG family protein n=1 Tax=Sphingomonas sp. IBVSS2 TaxID=1985172 RepID=UPI000A2EAAD9|nr:TIGR00730 family Rossman fold protein [Sphingomonas sp. IBVSS2]MDF2381947.1 TIGR00730 family Rossman fold protein [Nostoc ellipsosporum NOK]OSZ69818.1 Rossman fold protein, TIGR00730 family [Sphingomonas sp. IBVSS2]
MKRVAVYCGSATPADPVYIEAARHVGRTLAQRDIGIVYGGGRLGLMGAVADAALEAGGEVIGVIPELLVNAEVAHRGCTELHVVATMHERKARFTDIADGFINLPGGTGTMDELWEALSWAQLGYHTDPVGLLNIAGYYDKLVEFWQHMGQVGFVRPQHQNMLIVDGTLEGLLDKMVGAKPVETIVQMRRGDL